MLQKINNKIQDINQTNNSVVNKQTFLKKHKNINPIRKLEL